MLSQCKFTPSLSSSWVMPGEPAAELAPLGRTGSLLGAWWGRDLSIPGHRARYHLYTTAGQGTGLPGAHALLGSTHRPVAAPAVSDPMALAKVCGAGLPSSAHICRVYCGQAPGWVPTAPSCLVRVFSWAHQLMREAVQTCSKSQSFPRPQGSRVGSRGGLWQLLSSSQPAPSSAPAPPPAGLPRGLTQMEERHSHSPSSEAEAR